MIVSFIPWADLGVDHLRRRRHATQEVTTTMTGDELIATFIDDANDGATTTDHRRAR